MSEQEQRFSFIGNSSDYFVIWIVNLILTILTLGIYSAWAKVRRLQYLYRNTRLAGSSFDYHGTPIAILKGRLIAIVLFASYSIFLQLMPALGLAIGLIIALIMPYFFVTSLRFRLYNSSYRGLRFGFSGSVKSAYINFLLLPIASALTLFILAPYTHHRSKAYQHNNSHFGQSNFSFDATIASFYKIYFFVFLQIVTVVGLFALGIYLMFQGSWSNLPKMAIFAIVAGVYLLLIFTSLLVIPYFIARIQNLIWNHTALGEHRFICNMGARGLTWIILSNFFLIAMTMGIFKPFADIRLLRYKLEHLALLPSDSLDNFIASEKQHVSATGTESAEIFDVDISL